MISKIELLKWSVKKFTMYGSKRVTLDELADELGISKKTIYKYFKTKESLVFESVLYLLQGFSKEIEDHIPSNDPLEKIILIYKKGFEHLKYFKSSFLFGLKKYYPRAYILFEEFRDDLINEKILKLLIEAKTNGFIKKEVNLELVCKIYFLRLDNVAFTETSLFDDYTEKELLQHLIINNLRGIVSNGYTNQFIKN